MRIVSLLPSATELLFAIGAGPQVVATTHECDYPPEAQSLPRITRNELDHEGASSATIDRHIKEAVHQGSSIYHLDAHKLHELQPDLIVTQELCEVCAVSYAQVRRAVRTLSADVPVISLEPGSLDDILATALQLGDAVGCRPGADALVTALQDRIHAVDMAAAARATVRPPRVVCIEWTDPLMAGGHWVPEMVRRAGGEDPIGTAGAPSQYVEWDAMCAVDPEILVLMPCGYDLDATCAIAGEITHRPGFAELSCAKQKRVVAVDGSAYFNRPGPRIVDGLEILAAVIAGDAGSTLPAGARWIATHRSTPNSPVTTNR